ncbi:MAG: hypothetical protein GWN79_18965 [Actinobacteria bacterium]|nr:hypothetical protein [Actinomycetota bacterium]NIS34254.1 hypothetical protein [Actinomycetota bacterium]NIT97351.1 hypothetical protein [Actinomycetota bacterium]NIU21022.1 hypothetical protein [Actinomycetota bacterium]NIU69033.1 hypothetical protein [Actinomycetota bacterium]
MSTDEIPLRDAPRPSDDGVRPMVVFLCTGNAARSVMAAAMLRARLGDDPVVSVASGGTHVLPGQPMSVRTRGALARHGLRDPFHRSHQLGPADVERASLILAMEPDHVRWMRRMHPEGASRTGSLRRVVRHLAPGGLGDLGPRVASMGLERVDVETWEEVVDPGAGDQSAYDAAADEIAVLTERLLARLFHP